MWLEWLYQLAIDEWGGYGTGNALLLAARVAGGTFIVARLSLADNRPSRAIGQRIVDAALADTTARRARMSPDHRGAPFEAVSLPPRAKGKLAAIRLPHPTNASAETAPYRSAGTDQAAHLRSRTGETTHHG